MFASRLPTTPQVVSHATRMRSPWVPWDSAVTTAVTGSGVYFIRLVGGQSKPYDVIPRWRCVDRHRVLYIGSTIVPYGRSGAIAKASHSAIERFNDLMRRWGHQLREPRFEHRFIRTDAHWVLEFEAYLQHSYYYHFGELPPLNRSMNRALEKKFDARAIATIAKWPDVCDALLAGKSAS